jgi:hypothetical protein
MKKLLDSFLTNAVLVALVVLYMLYDEQCIYPGHPLTEDLAYGVFVAFGASFLAEVAKVIFVKKIENWTRCFWQWAIGAVIGFVLAFGIGYLIYGTL